MRVIKLIFKANVSNGVFSEYFFSSGREKLNESREMSSVLQSSSQGSSFDRGDSTLTFKLKHELQWREFPWHVVQLVLKHRSG